MDQVEQARRLIEEGAKAGGDAWRVLVAQYVYSGWIMIYLSIGIFMLGAVAFVIFIMAHLRLKAIDMNGEVGRKYTSVEIERRGILINVKATTVVMCAVFFTIALALIVVGILRISAPDLNLMRDLLRR